MYSWFELHLPKVVAPKWTYVSGFLSGLLIGAYNTGGPPVVVYADCRRWNSNQFKSNLQGFFFLVRFWSLSVMFFSKTLLTISGNYFFIPAPVLLLAC